MWDTQTSANSRAVSRAASMHESSSMHVAANSIMQSPKSLKKLTMSPATMPTASDARHEGHQDPLPSPRRQSATTISFAFPSTDDKSSIAQSEHSRLPTSPEAAPALGLYNPEAAQESTPSDSVRSNSQKKKNKRFSVQPGESLRKLVRTVSQSGKFNPRSPPV